jgi:hypothetical protein
MTGLVSEDSSDPAKCLVKLSAFLKIGGDDLDHSSTLICQLG